MSRETVGDEVRSGDLTVEGSLTVPSGSGPWGGRNKIINGGFLVWQRGTSFPAASHNTFTADRWWMVSDAVGTVNVSRQDVSAQGLGAPFALRAERSSGTNRWVVGTQLETTTLMAVKGRRVTLSAYIRKGPALTADVLFTLKTSATEYRYSTAVDVAVEWMPVAQMSTSSFTRFQISLDIPAETAAQGLAVEFSANQAGATGAYFDVTGVQLEVGPVATDFEQQSYGDELARCQRYFQRYNGTDHQYFPQGMAHVDAANRPETVVLYSTKRAQPTISASSPSHFTALGGTSGAVAVCTSGPFTYIGTGTASTNIFFGVASGIATYDPCTLVITDAAGYLDISAEL